MCLCSHVCMCGFFFNRKGGKTFTPVIVVYNLPTFTCQNRWNNKKIPCMIKHFKEQLNKILNETFWYLCFYCKKKRPQAEKKVKNPNICFANVIFLTRLATTGKAYYKTIKSPLFTNQKYGTACTKTLNKQKFHTNKYMINGTFSWGQKTIK